MGLLMKAGAVVLGLICLNVFLWPVSVICFGYLALSIWMGKSARAVRGNDPTRGSVQPPKPRGSLRFRKRYLATVFFFLLAMISLGARGAYSPIVFFSLGALITASGLVSIGPRASRLNAVPNSILLRSRLFPLRWVSLVEVKFGTPRMSRALSSVGSEMMLTASADKTSVYLPIRTIALSLHDADRKVAEKLGPLARALSARGAYVLPLESKEAASRLDWRLKAVDLALLYHRDGVKSLKSTPFDVLVMKPNGHLVKSAAAYAKLPASGRQSVLLPGPGRKLESEPMLWDALEALEEKFEVQPADAYTSFLSSVCATQGEPLGDRLLKQGDRDADTLLVSSLGTAQVQLTRPQLKAIVTAYG